MVDEDAQIIALIAVIGPPYSLEQLPVRNRFVPLRYHVAQYIKLLRRKVHIFVFDTDFIAY